VDGNFATEVISPRVYRVGVRLRFRNRDLADPIEANIRIPVLDLENVEDPNRYRLLLFDCDGNFQGQAGLFMPPNDDTQGSLLYTGINDSVLNITHTKVLLDSCQYLAVARGITTTSVSENPGWDRGFRFNRIYPNPSVGEANVEISIPETSEVKTTMYNVIGQAVWTKNEGRVVEGNHTISINDLALVPGAYHCQIEFSDAYGSDFHYIQSKKLILLE
ncbi:MAG: T9SS type A sorting domain-containing protein, partial [Saprospiraceae bacterium]|nr:T9SS type A sorting domain-containing protein [Saprospiraceae bacterium]